MDTKVAISKRVALELKDGELVNLGIGLPTMVLQFLPPGVSVYLQTDNGLVGMGAAPRLLWVLHRTLMPAVALLARFPVR